MSATPTAGARTDGGAGARALVRCNSDSTILENVESLPWSAGSATVTEVIWVTADRSAAEISAEVGSNSPGKMPASVEVISIADSTIPVRGGNLTVHTVPPPDNLGRLTAAIMDRVENIESAGHDVVLVIDDLTSVTDQYAPKAIFRFLHLLTARGRADGWTLQVGIDSRGVDDQVIEGLGLLFDEVL